MFFKFDKQSENNDLNWRHVLDLINHHASRWAKSAQTPSEFI